MTAPAGNAGIILGSLEQTTGRPLRAMIEISDHCNEVCVHCYQVQGQKSEMSTPQLKRVLDELAELGVLVLTISGGEATLRSDFLEIVAYARQCGFAVRVFTNGLTMTAELAQALYRLAVHAVEVSLYSQRAEVHDFVTGVPGSFAKTVAGIRHLVAAGVNTHVKTPNLSVNEDDTDAYVAFVAALGATFSFDPEQLLPREGGDRESERWSASMKARSRLLSRFADEPFAPLPERPLSDTLCGAGETYHIEANGELRPCTMLEVPLGNAIELGTRAARDHNPALQGMLALRWRDVHGCRECDLRAYCGRCHAASLAEVGDALGPYPSACRKARNEYALAHHEPARISAEGGRDPELGPYRLRGAHEFVAIDDVVTAADDVRATELGWVRRAGGAQPKPAAARPGELVQIRRPGKNHTKWIRVPESSAALSAKRELNTVSETVASEAAT